MLCCAVLPACRFALSILLLYVAAVIYYLYVRIAFTLDMKDRWWVVQTVTGNKKACSAVGTTDAV